MLSSLVRSATLGFVVMPHLYRGLDEEAIQEVRWTEHTFFFALSTFAWISYAFIALLSVAKKGQRTKRLLAGA